MSQVRTSLSSLSIARQVGPTFLEEGLHVPTAFSDGTVVFIKYLAVLEDHVNIILELILAFVNSVIEFLPDCGNVHGDLDDFLVSRELLGVDRSQERPGVFMT